VLVFGLIRYPTYFRIIPRRIDRLEFSCRTESAITARSFDLRNAIVTIDLTKVQGYVFVQGTFGAVSFGRNDTYNPLRFALAVARAATSEAETPGIPMDRLLG